MLLAELKVDIPRAAIAVATEQITNYTDPEIIYIGPPRIPNALISGRSL